MTKKELQRIADAMGVELVHDDALDLSTFSDAELRAELRELLAEQDMPNSDSIVGGVSGEDLRRAVATERALTGRAPTPNEEAE